MMHKTGLCTRCGLRFNPSRTVIVGKSEFCLKCYREVAEQLEAETDEYLRVMEER